MTDDRWNMKKNAYDGWKIKFDGLITVFIFLFSVKIGPDSPKFAFKTSSEYNKNSLIPRMKYH